ncbi:hypothetical protein BC332_14137 [Capsicum chinense]|nr:hypothetical protein BC332_14137 [Capsicum chinense]
MKRYFPQSTNGVDKEALVERFLKENFENKEDALQMTILYFIHTFINSQLNASPVPLSDVKMVENGKYEFFSWGKVSYSGLMALRGQEFFVEKQLYRLGGIPQVLNVWMFEHCSNVDTKVVVKEGYNIPRILNWKVIAVRPQFNQFMTEMFSKCSYANIVSSTEKFEKLDLPPTNIASDYPMPSSTENPDQRSYRVNLPQIFEDHDNFDDFSTTPLQFLMRELIHVSRTVSAPLSKSEKDVPIGRRSDNTEEKSKVDADSTCINRKELLVKADLDSLESEIKTYVKTYIDQKFKDLERLMNDRFSEVLKSLQPKNETVEKEKVAKQSPKEGQHSDDVADFEGHSNPISPHFVSEKIEKMEVAMIHIYYFNYLDDGIEKLSDIVVEKMQPLDSIIPGREHDMTLIIYKPPPTTPDEDMISDTVILSTFATPKKDVSDVKKTSAPHSRKPSKIYRSPF